ncbi:rhomboid family intramembrane serine protease [Stakelama sp. CBK3Z-3]|uniref:Rhomboid family intramembrane serine protease n=2 Tax=Stakelama flava TaxID=2860338 RepID=A0ABS6XGH8_9SPHN|nr:rhomboid family intramembrane serine protease [Stakelama flava]
MQRGQTPRGVFAGFGAPATASIAIATIVVSLALIGLGAINSAALWGGFIPARLDGSSAFAQYYSLAPVWLTPLTATFVHAGLLHLGFNMVMLGYTGREAERTLGARGILVLYVFGAYAAAAAQWLSGPHMQAPMIGASGALSAIVGAYSLLYGQSRAKAIGPFPARIVHVLWLALAWTGINLLIGLMSVRAGTPIAAAAHVGGFIAGLALARPLLAWRWRGA